MKFLFTLFVLLPAAGIAQSGADIWLFDMSIKKKSITLSNPRNITQRPGYDNQPFFHPGQPVIYYASFNDEGRSEIKSFDYRLQQTTQLTLTPEREYSPTVTPDGQHISCIIQRDNGAQDLGKYPIEGGSADVIVNRLKVGYHAWLDNSHIALFVLGDTLTLRLLRLPSQEDTVLARNIGRSLHKAPGVPAISFVQKGGDTWTINTWNQTEKKLEFVTSCLPGREDMAWTPDGKIVMSDGQTIFFYDARYAPRWQPVQMKPAWNGKDISRLAVSADGKKLAVVCLDQNFQD